MVNNPNWQKADQLAIYECGQGVELGATKKQLQLVVRVGLEPGISGFQVPHPPRPHWLPWFGFGIAVCLTFPFRRLFGGCLL